jgi:cyclophilin family peptidyl-prolyl cis-trans isomerase
MPRGSHPPTFRRLRNGTRKRRSPDTGVGAIAGCSVTCPAVPKKTRHRQLARQHQRRQAERRNQQRKRQMTTIVVALVIALVGGGFAYAALTGGDDTKAGASGAPGTTDQPTGATGATASSDTVEPQPGPAEVACGGTEPQDATKPKPQFSEPEQVVKKGTSYTAEMKTSCGTIVIELLADRAPETVNSFVFLAQKGYFDGQRFHRLDTSIDVIQGGDPTGTGSGGPGYTIPDELTGNESYDPGVLAMANKGSPDTGGSQFFLITGDAGHNLDASPTYTIFGMVVEGLDVAKRIQELPIQDPSAGISGQQPKQSVYIEKVTIRESS